MTEPRPDQVLTELLAAMAEAGVRTALLGGYAVVTWGSRARPSTWTCWSMRMTLASP